jgi:hypothetical protein
VDNAIAIEDEGPSDEEFITPEPEIEIEDHLGSGRAADDEEPVPLEYTITSYGADYPVDGLVSRIQNGDVYVPTFQRGYVWTRKRASRFIESLLLGLPVPGIFLSREGVSNKLLVIDGQQRLKTLQYFYDGEFAGSGRTFSLVGVQSKFEGLTFKALDPDYRRKLDDSIIHATVLQQDVPSEDDSSIYHVFERLNTGGTLLSAQEIRSAIYYGSFANLLRELNKNDHWRAIYGRPSIRMRDQELILRFFTLLHDLDRYERPFKLFLNKFMGRNRALTKFTAEELSDSFISTISLAREALGDQAFRPSRALNAAVYDSVMVGLGRRLTAGPISDLPAIKIAYDALLIDRDFQKSTQFATADLERIEDRLRLATEAFASVG